MVDLAPLEILDLGPAVQHNMRCAVCQEKHAVLNLNTGVFQPCWSCQAAGYEVRRRWQWKFWRAC